MQTARNVVHIEPDTLFAIHDASHHEKADYIAMAYELMSDMKTLGSWDGYLRYGKWINNILTFCKER